MKPKIAVLTRPSSDGYSVKANYLNSLSEAGALPFLIRPPLDPIKLREALEQADGLLIPGGTDIDPATYNENNAEGRSDVSDPVTDALDFSAVAIARAQKLPILGICRGLQVLNVAYGGTLYQDLETSFSDSIEHRFSQTGNLPLKGHLIQIEPGSRLHTILGDRIEVNTYHHQGVKQLGQVLVPVTFSPDGLIEAFEAPGVLAVQWHPERMTELPAFRALFRDYVRSCQTETESAHVTPLKSPLNSV